MIIIGGEDSKFAVDIELLRSAKERFGYNKNLLVNEDYQNYANTVCRDFSLQYPPSTHDDALQIYLLLLEDYEQYIMLSC